MARDCEYNILYNIEKRGEEWKQIKKTERERIEMSVIVDQYL